MKKEPVIGEKIYVPEVSYVYRGEDDFAGGIAIINKIEHDFIHDLLMIGIEGRPGVMYNWHYLSKDQKKLKKEFGEQIAHPDPDYREEFNQPNADWK
jgi:hypothetical protein